MSGAPEGLANAFGTMAEATLLMYRSAINSGATPAEAQSIIQAYFAASLAFVKSKPSETKKD